MNIRQVCVGESSFQAAGFAKTVLLGQTGFAFQQAVFRREKADTPAFDARYAEAMGDSGLPPAIKLDADELCEGMAASFTLLVRHMTRNDPETGRRPEYLRRYLKGPKEVIEKQVNWQLSAQKAADEATAAMLGCDATARVNALRAELTKQAESQIEPHIAAFVKHLAAMKDVDDEELINTALESLVNAGHDPEADLKRAAKLLIEAQAKRFNNGQFVRVDAGIYALAQ